ncbi:chemerin-like receptor 1 [Anomaloglossus baeobatrachus]|uniref:chemerin-like receptor 1 n=1 Tax=Anomaloglossus baeobatrachus TaxID=238106 RepID=UPI003F501329
MKQKTKIMENVTNFFSLENTTNLENKDYYENYTTSYNFEAIAIVGFCFALIGLMFCLLAIIGNSLVLFFGFFRMKKTVNVVWFLSLAIADFFFTLLLPVYIAQLLLGNWSKFSCKIMPLLLYLNSSVSVFQLTVISVDRCVCVVFPVWCHNHRRPRLAFIIVLVIWIISFALAIPYMLYADTSNTFDGTICKFDIDKSIFVKKTIFGFVLYFALPFIIIVSCYIVIALHMRRKRIFTSSKPFKTIAAVIVAFFICWFPIYLITFYMIFGSTGINLLVFYYGGLTAFVLTILNSCINPILYVFIGRDFKEKCCGSFQAKFQKAFIEDEEKANCKTQDGTIALTMVHTREK